MSYAIVLDLENGEIIFLGEESEAKRLEEQKVGFMVSGEDLEDYDINL